jgi:hypothetical protein
MPSAQTLERFVALVERNAHVAAVEEFYTENSSMQENQAPPRIGRNLHAQAERKILSTTRSMTSRCVQPVFVSGDRVVIRWQFRFEFADGSVMQLEELAYQRWEGERIAEETFFYDPAQRALTRPEA